MLIFKEQKNFVLSFIILLGLTRKVNIKYLEFLAPVTLNYPKFFDKII